MNGDSHGAISDPSVPAYVCELLPQLARELLEGRCSVSLPCFCLIVVPHESKYSSKFAPRARSSHMAQNLAERFFALGTGSHLLVS